MKVFKNYKNEDCFLTEEQERHIQERHPDASEHLISVCLISPIEIRRSSTHIQTHLYYIFKTDIKYFCVVLKCIADGNFISTAYTTTKIKNGQLIYKKEE